MNTMKQRKVKGTTDLDRATWHVYEAMTGGKWARMSAKMTPKERAAFAREAKRRVADVLAGIRLGRALAKKGRGAGSGRRAG